MTPLLRLLMFLIHCIEPKAVKPQNEPLAKLLHIGRGQDPLISQPRRTASMNMTRTSLHHGKGKQNLIMEINSMNLKETVGKPLIQTFLL